MTNTKHVYSLYIYIHAFEIQYIVHMGISVQAIILKYTSQPCPYRSQAPGERKLWKKNTQLQREGVLVQESVSLIIIYVLFA